MVIASARRHGLRVLVRPLLNEDNIVDSSGDWRGSIQPPSVIAWFQSYFHFLRPYFAAAQRNGATGFNVGSELDSLAPDKTEWTSFEASGREAVQRPARIRRQLRPMAGRPPYEPVPNAAVDAYPQLGLGDHATVRASDCSLGPMARHQPESVLRRTVLQEVGIAAAAGAYAEPAGSPRRDAARRTNTSRWFAAACAAAKRPAWPVSTSTT